jgi:Uma2 family endonuclease
MAIEHHQTISVEEYFQLEERDPDTLYEYIDGHVYAMAGGTADHDTIKSNLQRILWNLLRGTNCRVYSSDMKVFISETRYFHPDVTVTCNSLDRGKTQVIKSPRLVVEVLSPSTELTDRTWKLKNYRAHPTIEEYMLVDSQSRKIEIYH